MGSPAPTDYASECRVWLGGIVSPAILPSVPRYSITWHRDAEADLRYLGKLVAAAVKRETPRYLADQPIPVEGQAGRRKALEPNPLGATHRLQIGEYRVFYVVEEERRRVVALRVGHRPSETLYLRGRPVDMRLD